MKYCPHCTTLYQKGAVCPECMRPLTNEIQENDPVCVISADGFERERIVAALRDNGVPCVERISKKERSADAVTGKLAAKVKIQVPYGACAQAKDILIGIGAIHTDAQIISNENFPSEGYTYAHRPEEKQKDKKKAAQPGKKPEKSIEEFEEMSPAKRTTVRIVSALLFIVLVALVIFGVDYVANLNKGLF